MSPRPFRKTSASKYAIFDYSLGSRTSLHIEAFVPDLRFCNAGFPRTRLINGRNPPERADCLGIRLEPEALADLLSRDPPADHHLPDAPAHPSVAKRASRRIRRESPPSAGTSAESRWGRPGVYAAIEARTHPLFGPPGEWGDAALAA